jgi:hypothetical protein
VGSSMGSWYGVWDIGEDGCVETGTALENLNDYAEYTLLGYANRVRLVRPA